MVAIAVDYSYFLTFLYIFYYSFSILHDITSSSCPFRLEGRVGGEEPSTVLSFCLYQVNIKVASSIFTRTASLGPVELLLYVLSFVLLCTPLYKQSVTQYLSHTIYNTLPAIHHFSHIICHTLPNIHDVILLNPFRIFLEFPENNQTDKLMF